MSHLRFEWDDQKETSNRKKHGISFQEAASVFSDEFGRLIPDPDHSEGEERFILLGVSAESRLLIVCHCERGTDLIRIISARRADKLERRQYEDFRHA